MRITCQIDDVKAQIYIGRQAIMGIGVQLDRIRDRFGLDQDVSVSLPFYLADAGRWNAYPVAVVLHDAAGLYGAALMHCRTVHGLPLGVAMAGHKCGRGATVAAVAEQPKVAETASLALLRWRIAHTVTVRLPPACNVALPKANKTGSVVGQWAERDASSRLPLEGGMDGVMQRFSYKMRRNLRYYRRRADEQFGCVFLPCLTLDQTQQGLQALNPKSEFARSLSTSLGYALGLSQVDGSFAVGLQDTSGAWLSLLVGYRQGETTYVTSQSNHEQASASLMTVMRSYFLEHEVGRGTSDIVFVGGVGPSWSKSCVPQACPELLVVRNNLQSLTLRRLAPLIRTTGLMSEVYQRG